MQTQYALNEENALASLDSKVQEVLGSPQPDFLGRGIVVPGGGLKYFPCLWVCINMLRHHGCNLPIQVWHLGPEEMPEEAKGLLDPLTVEFVDAYEVRKEHPSRRLHGWELKPYAILHSPFQEVLLLDADNVAVQDPTYLFDTPPFKETGSVFWPDYGRLARDRKIWELTGVPYRDEPEFEAGQVLVDKARCWREMCLTMWFNEYSDFWYQHIHGDKDTFHMAWRKLGTEYAMPRRPIFALRATMCQHDFEDRRLFQHRNLAKWVPRRDENIRITGFELEDLCLEWIEQLHGHDIEKRLMGIASNSPTAKEELGGRRALYTRVGFESRSILLSEEGRITGAGSRESYWHLREVGGDRELVMYGDDGKATASLTPSPGNANIWCGAWHEFEKMPVELRIEPPQGAQATIADYSQWGEQHFILGFFRDADCGYFLDIGAGDGVRDSNTRALYERGWRGTLVEPVPEEFWRLEDIYAGEERIQVINAAIASTNGYAKMWVAERQADGFQDNRHTLVESVAKQAEDHNTPATYQPREVRTISVPALVQQLPSNHVDFLSIDAEGMDLEILGHLLDLGFRPRLALVEHQSICEKKLCERFRSAGYTEAYRSIANVAWQYTQ